MTKASFLACGLSAVLTFSAIAVANELSVGATAGMLGTRAKERFAAFDTNRDGTLSRQEACGTAKQAHRIWCRNFEVIDSDRNGGITLQEIRAFRRARAGLAPKS